MIELREAEAFERVPGRDCLTAGPSRAPFHLAWILALPRSRVEAFSAGRATLAIPGLPQTHSSYLPPAVPSLQKAPPDNSASSRPEVTRRPRPLLGGAGPAPFGPALLRLFLLACASLSQGSALAGAPSSDHSSPRIEKWVRVKTKIDTISHPLPSLEQPPGKPLPTPTPPDPHPL